ncbi:SUMF1/EgtB/PvdO family nonheme iron enzyme [Rhodohalobacter sp. SW132]|uniref:formylglycine-generating enzyme family protein n=1 Tax=Rhodohalobacter sp. SW132 TaxID=2293433 RepID=UPI0013143E75|nr:SUMF1/EgtB/PvdO family nonheme iron enzyme [Rhodohalobacter sp. SW132]
MSDSVTSSEEFTPVTKSIPGESESIELVPVPGGTFLMGAGEQEDGYSVQVDPFWMSKYEITWNQYNLFANESIENIRRELYQVFYGVDIDADAISSPTLTDDVLEVLREADIPADVISTPSPAYGDLTLGMGADGYPAINMTHYAAVMFTKWLTVKTGEFYRLPTEAEWEYACRAGDNEAYQPPENLDNYAIHRGNSNRSYGKVDSKEPNAFGIYNMLGNVAEWTTDQYHDDYFDRLEGDPAINPLFIPDELYPRAARGGSWTDGAEAASCLNRRASNPRWKMNDPQLPKSLWWHTNAPFIGFRVVKPKDQPESVEEMERYWIDAIQDYY